MNTGSRDTPTEEKTQRLGSGDGHTHSKAGGSLVMHDHGRRSPASAHSPGVSAKLPGLHPDSSRSSRGFGMPSFSTAGLPPGLNLEHHIPFLPFFPPFLHPSTSSLFPPVLPPNFLPPPLQPPLTSLFPSPNAECEVSSGWSVHSGGSRNTSSLGSSSSEGDTAAKIDGRTVRSSRCSPDMNLQPTSSSSVRKIWDSSVIDPVCISDADMPLSLVTRRETTSRGSSAAESGVCTGDSLARAASSETSRTPSLDGESGCHPVSENSGVQEQTVAADQPTQWPVGKVTAETPPGADDGKSSTTDDLWSSGTATSRSSGIALPPRKRLTRNAEELSSSTAGQSESSSVAAGSPSSAPNFRSCWKKFAAKSNVSGPSSHRAFGSKPQYDCRTYFQKLAEHYKMAAASKAFVPGKGKGHCYRNANKASPRSSDQNTGSPRVTRSQSKPKKSQSPKSSPTEPPLPVRKSTRKKSINTRFEEYDRSVGKNKKSKNLSLDSNSTTPDAGIETSLADGDEVTPNTEKNLQCKNRRRRKQVKGESTTDADLSSTCCDTEDSMSQSQLTNDAPQLVSEPESKLSSVAGSSVAAATHDGFDLNGKTEDAVEPEPSTIITVLPPKIRHLIRSKTAAATLDSSQPLTNSDQAVTTLNESNSSEVAASIKDDNTDSSAVVIQPVGVMTEEGEAVSKSGLQSSTENSASAETATGTLAEESKVSQSHSVGGRKSLLYRSSVMADSQPTVETKLALTGSQTEHSGSSVVDAVSEASVDQTSTAENCDNRTVLSADTFSTEHSNVVLDNTVPEVASAESSEKVQDNADEVHSQQYVEAEVRSVALSDFVSCKSASLATADVDLKASTLLSAGSNVTSDYSSVSASEVESSAVSVHSARESTRERLEDGSHKVPADSLNECDSHSKIEPCYGSSDISLKSGSQSVQSQSTDEVGTTTTSVLDGPRLSATPVTSNTEMSDLSCRTRLADISGNSVEDASSQNSDSLKRFLPDDVTVNDDAKRRCVDLIDHTTDRLPVEAVSQHVDTIHITDTAINLISSSGEFDSHACYVPNNKSYTVTAGKLQSSLSSTIQISSKPEQLKPGRSKGTKTNRKLKRNRNYHAVRNATTAEPILFQKFNSSNDGTVPAELESNRNNEKYDPLLLEIPNSGTTAVVKYAVANSVDKMCDINTDVCSTYSTHNSSGQKTLRISLVAINESNMPFHRVKDSRMESVCNSNKMSDSSPTMPVCTAATATVNNFDQLRSDGSLANTEPLVASADVSQDSVALENDRSALLSQCKALSVVLEKMRNSNRASLADSVSKPTSKRRRGKLLRHRVDRSTKPVKVSADGLLSTAEEPQVGEPLTSTMTVEDAYRFPDDVMSDSLPPQRLLRPERKTSSRKAKNTHPAASEVELSPAAASDTSSRGAASSVDSSVTSVNSGIRSLTPNTVQKVSVKPDTGTIRTRRRRHNLQDNEDTQSLSPFTENDSLPAPVVEASLDGHKLKLRIMKCTNRLVEAAAMSDTKVSVPPLSPPVELTDSRTKLQDDEVRTPDRELPPAVEVTPEPVSRRRRQLKVEGVRSRFLTLHKPSVVPSADHVKCRLVKVGRRHWMSVGGEEADDDSSAAQQSDAETPVKSSPAASSVDEMAQHPTRDRLLLVNESRKQRTRTGRRKQPPKTKTGLTDANSSVISTERTKKRVKMVASHLVASSPKPEPPRAVVSRPARIEPVPWLDCETDGSVMQPYYVLCDSSSRTIATDLDEYRSTPAEFTSDTDLVISNALSDCGIEFACDTLLAPRYTYFVPSELERLMEALVLDDKQQRPRTRKPSVSVVAPEAHTPLSTSTARTNSNSVLSSVLSPRYDSELDLLISQPSLRLRNCTLAVDANDSSDYDCTIVGYEHPARCYPDSVELPSLFDHQLLDEDCLLQAPLSDTQLYSCVDFVL